MPMNRHAEGGAEAEEGFESWSKEDLKAQAAEWEIAGRSAMSREELIDALNAANAEGGGAVVPAHDGDT